MSRSSTCSVLPWSMQVVDSDDAGHFLDVLAADVAGRSPVSQKWSTCCSKPHRAGLTWSTTAPSRLNLNGTPPTKQTNTPDPFEAMPTAGSTVAEISPEGSMP